MRHIAITLLLLALSIDASAQGPSLQSGDRVRIHLPEVAAQPETPYARRLAIRGNVSRVSIDTLFLRVFGTHGELAVPRTAVLSLFRSRGVPSRPVSGIRKGLTLGLLTSLYAGLTYGDISKWGVNHRSDAFALGFGFGAMAGFLHGFVFPTERWTRVQFPAPGA